MIYFKFVFIIIGIFLFYLLIYRIIKNRKTNFRENLSSILNRRFKYSIINYYNNLYEIIKLT